MTVVTPEWQATIYHMPQVDAVTLIRELNTRTRSLQEWNELLYFELKERGRERYEWQWQGVYPISTELTEILTNLHAIGIIQLETGVEQTTRKVG